MLAPGAASLFPAASDLEERERFLGLFLGEMLVVFFDHQQRRAGELRDGQAVQSAVNQVMTPWRIE